MNELSKSALRRSHDPAFLQHYFAGRGLDICGAGESLATFAGWFPRVQDVKPWRKSASDMQEVPGIDEQSLDFVHASLRLQTLANPHKALARWLDLVKPGGYVIFTVPDEDFLTPRNTIRLTMPGKNPKAQSSGQGGGARFTIYKPPHDDATTQNLLDTIQLFSRVASCERMALVRDHEGEAPVNGEADTRRFVEGVIEVVLRKRAAPGIQDLLGRANAAQNAEDCVRCCREAVATYPYRFQAYLRSIMLAQRWSLMDEIDHVLDLATKRLHGEWNPQLYQMLHYIKSGRLNQGFQLRERMYARINWQRRTKAQPPANTPAWTGQPLEGKRIVIWSEFGLGDEIFFLRFARVLREQCGAAHVTVVCQGPIFELFKASGEADDVVRVDATSSLAPHDFWVYPHAIMAHLPVDVSNLPQTVPFLRVPEAASLPGRPEALKVGVVFKGAPNHENDHARSLRSLSVLDALFAHQEVDFYSLQKGPGADEAADYARRLPNFYDIGAGVQTMIETAQAVQALDLLVTVDTSVAHVAGALGKQTWLFLPFYTDWRWFYEGEDSPWYPSMRLFRQRWGAEVPEVIARMNGELLGLMLDKQRRQVTVGEPRI
ncbi:methyltransferase domain-containing protein [Cupriavidus sp. SZY C1]|uniref:methyltransferase domain-containing protein n=1 Tax=Cupriavidus sp. SZY C1 TaxID=3055037 RepID=UPI0028B88269|nr:methyltransferase domain-containing protein [Cupriavidus sp. SZY C1]MDT6964068.1 methyltransferase domain-containing protein [Cupriavidus sp. SZY C1]